MFETEIKAALKKAGLAENLYDQIKVNSADEIDGAIATLKANIDKGKPMTETEFIELIKTNGQEELLNKYISRVVDRRVTEAIKTHDEKLKKAEPKQLVKEDMTAEEKRIAELEGIIKGFDEKLNSLTTKLTTSEMDSRIKAEIKKAGLAEEFADYVKTDDPEKITEAVNSLKTRIEQAKQADINKMLENGELSSIKKGNPGNTLAEAEIAAYAKSLEGSGAPKNPDFQGKLSAETATVKT